MQRYPCHFLCQRSWVTCGKDIDQGRLIYVPAIVSTVDFLFLFMSCALFLRSWICVRWNSTARQLRKSGEDYDIIHAFYWPLPAMCVCVCVGTLNQRVKAGGPWTHRWHGPTKTHLCRHENVPAKLSSSEMAGWPSQKPPMPTCHDRTWHANVATWHDGYHFISFHPLQIQGVYQSVSFMHPDLW